MSQDKKTHHFDVIVIGAGFAGLYALHRLRGDGYSVRVLEAGGSIGGTWYWNRYPGARCDVESMQYSFSFSDEIQREWEWSQLYAPQPEIHDTSILWRQATCIRMSSLRRAWSPPRSMMRPKHGLCGRKPRPFAPFCIMATGCLSIPIVPTFPGMDDFKGGVYRTSDWPHEGVDLTGKRIGLIGTGSSGIQVTPILAEQADQLYVFQRTPNYTIPALNKPMAEDYERAWKDNYNERRLAALQTRNNTLNQAGTVPGRSVSRDERREFERRWTTIGGIASCMPIRTDQRSVNAHASDFVRRKIAAIVRDPLSRRS
jgi:cyclohexanone monooxygenase